jgi:hypothetical protein
MVVMMMSMPMAPVMVSTMLGRGSNDLDIDRRAPDGEERSVFRSSDS